MAMYKRKDSPYWWVNVCVNGKRVQKSTGFTDKKKAKEVERVILLAGAARSGVGARGDVWANKDEGKRRKLIHGLLSAIYGDDSDRTRLDTLWEEYADTVKVRGKELAERTLREKHSDWMGFLRWAQGEGVTTLDGVTASVARKYSIGFVGKVGEKRRSNIIRGIASVWNAILPAHPGVTNPWSIVAPSIDPAVSTRVGFTAEEEQRVLAAAKEIHPQWYVACVIGRNTGLRYGDVCSLIRKNIDFENGVIRVVPHKTMKSSGVSLTIPMTEELARVLGEWVKANARMTGEDRVLPWLKARGQKRKRRFREVLRKAGIDGAKYSFHSWRHTVESKLCKAGASLDIRKRVLGHTSDVMADRYNHADLTTEMKSALDIMSKL